MITQGFELALRLYSFPFPVVIAVTGSAIAMGVFIVLAGDYRIGREGPFKICANEVAIGLTMSPFLISLAKERISPAFFHRAMIFAEAFNPLNAEKAGFLDEVVVAKSGESIARQEDVIERAKEKAIEMMTTLSLEAFAATKLRGRDVEKLRNLLILDDQDLKSKL